MTTRKRASPIAASLKSALRALHRDRVAAVPAKTRKALAAKIVARLESLPEYAAARTIMFYWPVPRLGEVDFISCIRAALKANKAVCLPRIDWETGRMTARQVRSLIRDLEFDAARPHLKLRQPVSASQPVPATQLDLILVPGLAFDRAGNRLGRGAGFYDRFLFGLSEDRPLRLALAFDEQISEEVTSEPHDQPVHVILTPSETIRISAPRRLTRTPRSGRNTRQAQSPTRARPRR